MDEKELKEYIDGVEERLNRAFTSAEGRIGNTVTSTEKRLKEWIADIDNCVKDLKKGVQDVKLAQETCSGFAQIKDVKYVLDNHLEKHQIIKDTKKVGFTKIQFWLFVFFSIITAMGIIVTLIIQLSKDVPIS